MKVVIFACVHNAGRSQMAAAWFNALADATKARAISAGTAPGDRVHPEVLEAMREVGIDLAGNAPQKLTDGLTHGAHMLVTMGCGEQCPVVPGVERDDWPLEDPKGKPLERVRAIRDDVKARVLELLEHRGWARPPIRRVRPEDRAGVEALLVAESLPTSGVADHFDTFFVADDGARIDGAVGLEFHGPYALLRSLVVSGHAKGRGVGGALTRHALDVARAHGARAVYLLTTTAETFFPRFGFEIVARADVPPDMHASKEFQGACPASAIVMRRTL